MSLEDAIKAWELHFMSERDQRRANKKIILDSPEKEAPQELIIPQLEFKSEPRKKQRLKQQLQEDCPICMNDLDTLPKVCEIDPCKHQICQECITEWAQKYKMQCPCCRVKFKKVWPLKGTKRSQSPLKLDLKQEKWNQDEDLFYNDEEEDCRCQVCQCTHTPYLMLVCDRCDDQCCHTFCDPAIKEFIVPQKKWYCLDCRKSRYIYYKHK